MRIASVGHAVFAVSLVTLGLLGLVTGDFTQVLQAVPKGVPGREILPYVRVVILVACGTGLLWQRVAASAARVLLAYLLLWTLLVKARFIFIAPTQEVVYQNLGESLVLVAGTWVLYAWFATDWDRRHLGFATGDSGVRIARVLYGLAMITFGLSHFAYLNNTAGLVPAWLPWHVGWAYFTGATYLAAAVAILIGVCGRLAAALSTAQMGGFTLLVWVPMWLAGTLSTSQRGEFLGSWMLTAAAWVVADSYLSTPWLAAGQHDAHRSRRLPIFDFKFRP